MDMVTRQREEDGHDHQDEVAILDNDHPEVNSQGGDDLNTLISVNPASKRLFTLEPVVFLVFFAVNLWSELRWLISDRNNTK